MRTQSKKDEKTSENTENDKSIDELAKELVNGSSENKKRLHSESTSFIKIKEMEKPDDNPKR